ncbi:MAG TPA: hypothetical protein VGQ37_14965 [Vicinamibacterales bacterium]|nr:hypothetical protein [Vicinamibacterales bacterium]
MLVVLLAGPSLLAQNAGPPRPFLATSTGYAEYYGEEYTERPSRSGPVVFAGEPLAFLVRVTNRGTLDTAPLVENGPPFTFTSYTSPRPASRPVAPLHTPIIGGKFVDESPVELRLGLQGRPTRITAAGRSDLERAGGTSLAPGDQVEWRVEVGTAGLPPAFYRVEVRTELSEGGHRPDPPVSFEFDVRATTASDRAEILRRQSIRALSVGDHSTARGLIAQLEAVHPGGYVAPYLLAKIAAAEGNKAEARRHMQQARDILRQGSDALLLKFNPSADVRSRLWTLEAERVD